MNDEGRQHDWRQATLTMALEEHFGRRPPDVAAAVHAAGTARTGGHSAAGPRDARAPRARYGSRLAIAATMLLGIGAVVAVAAIRDDRTPAQDGGKPLLPLVPGTQWVFDATRDGRTREVVRRVLGAKVVTGAGERQHVVHQVLVLDGNASGFEYWSADDRGVYRHAALRGGPAVAEFQPLAAGGPWTRVVALPLGTETAWTTTAVATREVDRVVAAGGAAAGGRTENVALDQRAELVAAAAEVRVPAGTFRAVHVRIVPAAAGGAAGDMGDAGVAGDAGVVEQLWFAPGVGIVRATRDHGGVTTESMELRSSTPGREVPAAEQVLRTFLAKDAGVTNFGPVQSTAWLAASGELLLPSSRFAVVTFVDRTVVYRVQDGKVTEFDPAAVDSWTALVRDEDLTDWRAGLLTQHRCVGLADLVLRLHALRHGMTVTDSRFMGINIGLAAATCTRGLVASAADGGERSLQLKLTIAHDGTVRRLELRD